MDDPFGVLEHQCRISSSQEHILTHSPFALEDDFPPPSAGENDWPEFSSSSGDLPNDVIGITICSAPATPTSPPEEFKTPPEVAGSTSDGGDSVDLGFRKRKREREREASDSPPQKKLGFRESTQLLASDGGDTEKIDEIDDSEEIEGDLNLNLDKHSNSGPKGLLDWLRDIASREICSDKDEQVDIFETAKRRGMTFPRSRWYGPD